MPVKEFPTKYTPIFVSIFAVMAGITLPDRLAQAAGCNAVAPTAGEAGVGCSTEGSGGSNRPPQQQSPRRQPPSDTSPRDNSPSEGRPGVPLCGKKGHLRPGEVVCYLPDPSPAAPQITPEQAAQQALATMQLPEPTVTYTPSPRVNPWNKHFIGVPYRYVISDVTPQSLTHTEQNITITMTTSTPTLTINHGDGTTQRCTTTHACTHRYQYPGTYTTTVTAHWTITWHALGQTGTLTTTTTTSSPPTQSHEIHTLLTEPKHK